MVTLSFSANAYIDKQLTLLNCCTLEVLFNWFKNNSKLNNLIVYENDIFDNDFRILLISIIFLFDKHLISSL